MSSKEWHGATRALSLYYLIILYWFIRQNDVKIVGLKIEIPALVIGESGLKMHSFYVISPQSESLWGPNIVFGCSTIDQMKSIFESHSMLWFDVLLQQKTHCYVTRLNSKRIPRPFLIMPSSLYRNLYSLPTFLQ